MLDERLMPLDKGHNYGVVTIKIGRENCGEFSFPKEGEVDTDCEVAYKEAIEISDMENEETFKSPIAGALHLVTSKRTGQALKVVG